MRIVSLQVRIPTVVRQGFAYGALLFGGSISLLHLVHNRLPLVQDSLVLWLAFTVLFGVPVAAIAGAVLLLRRTLEKRGHASKDTDGTTLLWTLVLFHLAFTEPFVIYGFTYGQVPWIEIRGAFGMLVFLLLLALGVGILVVALSFLVARALRRLLHRGVGPPARFAAAALALLHISLPLLYRALEVEPTRAADRNVYRPLRDESRLGQKVVFLGLDGADWQVIDTLVEKGELPHFANLMRTGSRADLATIPDANSAVIWASIYTGTAPQHHRCHDFYRIHLVGMRGPGVFPVHRTYFKEAVGLLFEKVGMAERRVVRRSCIRTRPIWEILDDLRVRIGVVDGYLYSSPIRDLRRDDSFFYSYLLNSLEGGLDDLDGDTLRFFVRPFEALRHVPRELAGEDFFWQSRTLLSALEAEGQPDFVQLYTHQPDTEQHQYWKWFQPQLYFAVDAAELEENGDRIASIYRHFDEFLGELQESLDPQTTLIVASDHGHSATLVHRMYTQHRHGPPGILLMSGPGIRHGRVLENAHVLDLVPTILHILGYPVAADFDGRVLSEAFDQGWLDTAPIRTIDSYEVFADPVEDDDLPPDLNAEELERLRNMGYIL